MPIAVKEGQRLMAIIRRNRVEIKRLREALRKYGRHIGEACSRRRVTDFGCECGFHDAAGISLEDDIRRVVNDDDEKVADLLKHYAALEPQ